MKSIQSILKVKKELQSVKDSGLSIGFVPTMGFFHKGHLKLMEEAKKENDLAVVSIFVNPTQFGEGEDFGKYPRDLKRDQEMAESAGVDIVFNPSAEDIYLDGLQTEIAVSKLSSVLCGKNRKGHFTGVATVVAKLLNIVEPDKAYFGLKDYQQYLIVCQMVKDLNINVNIVGVPTVRDEDGLAASSRNIYLAYDEREEALILYECLKKAQRLLDGGIRNTSQIKKVLKEMLDLKNLVTLEYLEIVNKDTLEAVENIENQALVAIAAKVGKARLIDNMVIG
ncbi:MAG: pantoate--beta-alanine ligase [Actinobacteria bacterium]|nr:MAG: pantoate--beta-alanine ligase [Actinomycetota bacterium]